MSVTDAKALTRAQVEERACKHLRSVQGAQALAEDDLASEKASAAIAVATHRPVRAQEVEDLYQERFGGKVSKCMRPDAPGRVPPPHKPVPLDQ